MADLTPAQVDALLDKLSTDDAYRTLFVTDLKAAFAQLPGSPPVPPNLPPRCCLLPKQLAPKEKIAEAKQDIASKLTGQSSHIPHLLE